MSDCPTKTCMVNRIWVSPDGEVTIQWLTPAMRDLTARLGRAVREAARGPGASCDEPRGAGTDDTKGGKT